MGGGEGEPYRMVNWHVVGTVAAAVTGLDEMAAAEAARATRAASRTGNASSHAWAEYANGIAHTDADPERARASFERATAVARSVDNGWLVGMNLTGLATILRRAGRLGDARDVLRELIVLWHRANNMAQLRAALTECALALSVGDQDAARLALAVRDRIALGHPPLPADQRMVGELRHRLGDRGPWLGPLDPAVDELVRVLS